MPLRDLSRGDLHALRDEAEGDVQVVLNRAMRAFLRDVTRAARTAPLVAAAGDEMLTLGQLSGWWAAYVDADVAGGVRDAWMKVYRRIRGGTITATSLDGLDTYMAKVTDRLVRGLTPPIADDAFNHVRLAVTESAAQGWTRPQLAQRIAADLGWEVDGPYWRKELTRIDKQIDGILDPLGKPGNPIREAARLNDPRVQALRNDRNRAIATLDREHSYWQDRATRIARTEATAANNYGHLSALRDEGVGAKEWIATSDTRTRPTHTDASGQVVPVGDPFTVGGALMQFPGDPSAPAAETVRCRCIIVGAELAEAKVVV